MKPVFEWRGRTLTVMRSEYQYGSCKQPAILCFDDNDPECSRTSGCPYGILTVNLDSPTCEPMGEDMPLMQFLDVNNWSGIEEILDGCDWCQPTGIVMQSGFVSYPLWYFDKDIDHV